MYYAPIIVFPEKIKEQLKKLREKYNKYEGSLMDPHLTLKQPFKLLVDFNVLDEKLEKIAKGTESFNLVMDGIKYFEGENNVAYVSFKDVEPVVDLHKKIVDTLRELSSEIYKENYELDRYLPHATIGEKIPDEMFPTVKQELSVYSFNEVIKINFFSLYFSDDTSTWREFKVYKF